jgi:hypothetical protein
MTSEIIMVIVHANKHTEAGVMQAGERLHPFGSAADRSSTRELRVPINEENNEVRFLDGGNVHLGLIRGKHQRGMCSDVVLSRRYSALKNI